ncbi:SbtR family transcriptional regulator [Streptomyces mirabilis]|uniref:SbtR family transcriptional regulator n=1 Tax=Streptomyces mirabilis TaxID=68239 RepID=UPI0036587B9A
MASQLRGTPRPVHDRRCSSGSSTTRQVLASASLNTVSESRNLIYNWHDPLETTITELLANAREHGTARADVNPTELLVMTDAIATAAESTPDAGGRLLDIALDGITPP